MARKVTNKLIELVDDGVLDKDTVILACLNYLSEDEVADMCRANDFPIEEENDQ